MESINLCELIMIMIQKKSISVSLKTTATGVFPSSVRSAEISSFLLFFVAFLKICALSFSLLVCLLVCLVYCLFVCLLFIVSELVGLLVDYFVRLLVGLVVCSFVLLFVYSLACLFCCFSRFAGGRGVPHHYLNIACCFLNQMSDLELVILILPLLC